MQDPSLADGARRRDFAEVIWHVAERRGCDEVVVRYDCGHAVWADVWAPSLPKTREYGPREAERRRFAQHSLYVLTRDPGATKLQVTVPEGRCRHCGRGQRQVLIFGLLQMDLVEERPRTLAAARRLELPLSGHTFLAAMGQVCQLPENVSPPPLVSGSQTGGIRPFDGPPLPREGLRQWARREVEDELKAEVLRCVGSATCLLLLAILAFLCFCASRAGLSGFGSGGAAVPTGPAGELLNLSSVSALEMGIANSTWALSTLTLSVHKAFGPAEDGREGGSSGTSWLWSLVLHPLWVLTSLVLAPVLWALDLAVAVPRFLVFHVCIGALRGLILRPCGWILSCLAGTAELVRYACTRPTAVLTQVPMTSPMVAAMILSLLVAIFSAPQPPSLSLPSVWGELPNLEISRCIRRAASRSRSLAPLVQRLRTFGGSTRKDGRPKGGGRGVAAGRGQRERSHAERSGRERADAPGRPDRPQAGQKEGRAPSGSSHHSAPACFVCLDRPSRYVLEPCGHRVVCGECAVQLVEAAARCRSSDAQGGAHHAPERGGGACPSCGTAVSRAMRLFP